MKLNKKRKDARLPNWLIDILWDLQIKYQWTFTEALIRTAEKGSTYYGKRWAKMHPSEKASEEAQENDERCPNDRQNDYKEGKPKKEPWKDDPNLKEDIEEFKKEFGKDPSTEKELNDYMWGKIQKKLNELYGDRK